jgi:type II secretory pathway pseudopilin PulG
MSKTKIFTYVFGVLAVILAFVLYNSINSSIEEAKRIQRLEAQIIEQLKMIREAELAYASVNGVYTSDWDKLIAFVDSGRFYITERTETIITLDYGADSTYVEIDTLGTKSVRDSIFKKSVWPRFNLITLPFVPNTDPPVRFEAWADKIEKSGIKVNAIEVVNPKPVDANRDPESELNLKKPLRFGSRTSVTTAGNWE